jgi:hypothetical protein
MKPVSVGPEQIQQAHRLYCELTGQNLSLGFDRERQWYELLRLGIGPEQIKKVIRYLQREIREKRRNVGALKLSNLLQPDRFEEDLNISQVQLQTVKLPPSKIIAPLPQQPPNPEALKKALDDLAKLKADLGYRTDHNSI